MRRLKSLHAYGGDIFFAGIARHMVAQPFIPNSFRAGLSVPHQEEKAQEASSALIRSQKKRLTAMTRTNNSVAGGGGPVPRESPPSKAYCAANKKRI